MASRLAAAWLGTFVTESVIKVLGVATGILAARLLLPDGRGALAAVLIWPQTMAAIGLFSLKESVTYSITQHPDESQAVTLSGVVLALLLVIPTGFIAYLVLPTLLGPERAGLVPLARTYLLAFLPLNFVSLTLVAEDLGQLRFARYNLVRTVLPVAYLTGILLLWATGHVNVDSMVKANLASAAVFTAVRLWLGFSNLRAARPAWSWIKQLLSVGWKFHGASVVFIFATQGDRLVVISLLDNAAVGLYVVALAVASSALQIITQTFHTVLFPNIARHESFEKKRDLLAKALRQSMVLLLACSLPLMALAKWLIPVVFGPKFADASLPGMILVAAYVPMGTRQVLIRCLRGLGRGLPGTVGEGIALSAFLGLAWPLTHLFGLEGVGLALFGANVIAMVYLASYLSRCLALPFRQWNGFNVATLRVTCTTIKDILSRRRPVPDAEGLD